MLKTNMSLDIAVTGCRLKHLSMLLNISSEHIQASLKLHSLPTLQVETPFNMLVLDGRACKLHRNLEQHTAIEREEGLIPWNGHADHLIDRFDGRAMLDMYREPAPNLRDKPKTAEESKLELVSFWQLAIVASAVLQTKVLDTKEPVVSFNLSLTQSVFFVADRRLQALLWLVAPQGV